MKEYTTVEAIQQIIENNTNRFVHENDIMSFKNGWINVIDKDKEFALFSFKPEIKWFKIRPFEKDVDFIEAMRAHERGLTLLCISYDIDGDVKESIYFSNINTIDNALISNKGISISSNEILNGNWYILNEVE